MERNYDSVAAVICADYKAKVDIAVSKLVIPFRGKYHPPPCLSKYKVESCGGFIDGTSKQREFPSAWRLMEQDTGNMHVSEVTFPAITSDFGDGTVFTLPSFKSLALVNFQPIAAGSAIIRQRGAGHSCD